MNCLGIYTNDDKEECYNKKIDENIPWYGKTLWILQKNKIYSV